MVVFQEALVSLILAILKINLTNEQGFEGVHSHVVSWTNQHQATDRRGAMELFNWLSLQIAMRTV